MELIPELDKLDSSSSKQHVDCSHRKRNSSDFAAHFGPFKTSNHLADNGRHGTGEEEFKIQIQHPAVDDVDDPRNASKAISRESSVNEPDRLIEEEAYQPLSSEPNHELSEANKTDRSEPLRELPDEVLEEEINRRQSRTE